MRLLTALLLLLALLPGLAAAETLRVGTWKTAQTIQPFFYQEFLPAPLSAEVFAFTNPVDQKTALLAGSLDLAGTTLAHAIHSAVLGQPVVLVAALCHKCSALVVAATVRSGRSPTCAAAGWATPPGPCTRSCCARPCCGPAWTRSAI